MTIFVIEAVALCVLFHLTIWSQVRQEPTRRVYSYHPVIANIPLLIVMLILVFPVALFGMILAEKVLKKQAAALK